MSGAEEQLGTPMGSPPTMSPPAREYGLILRFHFIRVPGVQSSCIGVVRNSDPFNCGERAVISIEDMGYANILLKTSKPLFDEHGILETLQVLPHLRSIFHGSNTFGTWSDACLHRLIGHCGDELQWKAVGTDKDLLPVQVKAITFTQSLEKLLRAERLIS
ncbi:unnamed protein product [Periconia digitata]|uniref:Uncharacterized protein n=1 Tax=Periconia digitata TaxID=1303443 RepID=A0A9W4UFR4_9PLEO|nr:unnamed protein product [Periconia digitata]